MPTPLPAAKSATDAAGDLFLSGSYIELGISPYGNFGTTPGQTPAGYAQAGSNGVGLTFNAAGFGVDAAVPTIDFFTPGSPWEAFAAGYVSNGVTRSGYNYKNGGSQGITTTSLTNTSSGSTLSAKWVGVLNSALRVTLDYSFQATDQHFTTMVTLTNISGSPMSDVRYDRNIDPDNTVFAGGSFATINTIMSQAPGDATSKVTAVSAASDAYARTVGSATVFSYASNDPHARVAVGYNFGGPLDPFNPAFTTNAGASGTTTGSSDTAVNINFDLGALAAGASVSMTYDTGVTTSPAGLALAPASDSGLPGDRLTKIARPTITGTAARGSAVTLYNGTTAIGTGTADPTTGAWAIAATTPLSEGANSLTATSTDAAGNASAASAALAVTIDTAAPAVPAITSPALTNVAAPVLAGTAEAGDTITITVAGATYTALANSSRTWSVDLAAAAPSAGTLALNANGANAVTASATDPAGNPAPAAATQTLVIDTTAPAVPAITSPALTNLAAPVLAGTAEAGDTVTVAVAGATYATLADGNGAWRVDLATAAPAAGTLALNPNGTNDVSATSADPAGNPAPTAATQTLTIDTMAPVPPAITSPALTNLAAPMLAGTAEAGDTVTVTVAGATYTTLVSGGGAWSVDLAAATPASGTLALDPNGPNAVSASASDPAGNPAPTAATRTLTIDTTAPAAPAGLALLPASDSGVPGDGLTNVALPTLAGTAEPGSTVTLYNGTTAIGTDVADPTTGAWVIAATTPLSENANRFTATSTDQAGNTSAAFAALALTLDTAAPAAPAITSPALTNLIAPMLAGTAEAGSTVTVAVGSATYVALTSSSGTWSVDLATAAPVAGTLALTPNGTNTVSATSTDPAGNPAPAAATQALTTDTTAPAVTAALARDTGASATDGVTADPTLAGTGDPGATVTLTEGATVLATATADAAGAWRFAPALADGPHSVVASETDAAGNIASATASFTLLATVPAAPVGLVLLPASDSGLPGDRLTNVARPTITGTAARGSAVTLYNGTTAIGTGTADPTTGAWAVAATTPLSEGANSLTATSTDAAGNASAASAALAVTIDTAAPLAPAITSPALTNAAAPVLAGTAEAGDAVTVTVAGATYAILAGSTGAWSIDLATAAPTAGTLALNTNGTNAVTASATDPTGNASPVATQALAIDTTAPAVPAITSPALTNAAAPVLAGTAEAGDVITVAVAGATYATLAGSSGAWSIDLATAAPVSGTLAMNLNGSNAVTASATDPIGNASPVATQALAIDTTAPAVTAALARDTGLSSTDGVTADPTLAGTGDPGATVTLTEGATVLGTAAADAAGAWSFAPALADGPHSVVAHETDAAGNIASATASFTLLATAPVAPAGLAVLPASDSGLPGDGLTNVPLPTLTGIAEPGNAVTLYNGTAAIGTGTADPVTGAFSITATATLAAGLNQITATSTDQAGNTSLAAAALKVTLDTAAPAVTAVLAHDTGASTTDGVTADPTLTGTGDPGATVTLTEGKTVLGAAAADPATGAWSFTPTLPDGPHSVVASETDAAGNPGAATASFTLLATAPAAPAGLALLPASDSGTPGDDLTNVARPTLTGIAEPGGSVILYDGTTAIGTATADAHGLWSIASSTLAQGEHTLTAIAIDVAGKASDASQPFALTIRTAAPAIAALTATPSAAGPLGIGRTISLALASDAPVTVGTEGGRPSLALSDGGTADYMGQDSSGALLFTATVAAGQNSADLKVTGLALNGAAVADAAGNLLNPADLPGLAGSDTGLVIDTTAPAAPRALALTPATDTGRSQTDGITRDPAPTITGTAAAGSTVTLYNGPTRLGTATAGMDGAWSVATGPLPDNTYQLTATATDAAGNVSALSRPATLTIDTATPAVTAAAVDNPAYPVTHTQMLAGGGGAGATVTISEAGTVVGTAQAGADGRWSFDPSGLRPGAHTLTASETNVAGTLGRAPAVALTVPDPRFDLTNVTAATSGSFTGGDYTGPVSYLQAEYAYTGSDNVVFGARVANVFLVSGAGEDALAAKAGSNVLSGGTGSNWLVGADGTDGGTDTFFVDSRGGQSTWDTLVNFHPGDMLTLWGYNGATDSLNWSDNQGAAGYHGATLHADFGSSGVSALVTFAGLTTSNAQFATSTGSSGGVSYLAGTRIA